MSAGLGVIGVRGKRRQLNRRMVFQDMLLFLYFCAVVYVALWPSGSRAPQSGALSAVNLTPYIDVILRRGPYLQEALFNIMMTLPLPIILWFHRPDRPLWQLFVSGLCLSLMIESSQYLLVRLSLLNASVDITDLINNTLGGILGSLLVIIGKWLHHRIQKQKEGS